MCANKRKYPLIAALFFSIVPAVLVGIITTLFTVWPLGLITGGCFFGFSMDMLLNGRDRRKHKRVFPSQGKKEDQ